MKVRLTVNLGHADARRLGCDERFAGAVVDVDAEAAEEMLAKGWACRPTAAKVKAVPATMKAVPE